MAFLVLDYFPDDEGANPPAQLRPDEREWFERQLGDIGSARPVVLVMHPLPQRWSWLEMPDWIALPAPEADYLADVVSGRNVAAILCGHFHGQHVETWRDIPVVCVGSWTYENPYVVLGHVENGELSFVSYHRDDLLAGKRGPGKSLVRGRRLRPGSVP